MAQEARDVKTLGDTRYQHTVTSSDWSVSCYWMSQFSEAGASNLHVLVVLPSAKYGGNEARIEAHLDKLLAGVESVDANTVRRWNSAMGHGDLKMVLTDNPQATLSKMGLQAPSEKIREVEPRRIP